MAIVITGGTGGLVCCGFGVTLIKVLGLPMTHCASPGFRLANYEPRSTGQKGWGQLSDHENKVGVDRKETTYPGRPLRAGTHLGRTSGPCCDSSVTGTQATST